MDAPPLHDLDAAILAAHAGGDGVRLAELYGAAAAGFAAAGEIDTACFFYTQAYVFALEQGTADAPRYAELLRTRGRL